MSYSKLGFVNGTEPALNQDNLNHMDQGIYDGNTLSGTTDPTTATAGVVGQFYINTSNSYLYQCTSTSGGIYVWNGIGQLSAETISKFSPDSPASVDAALALLGRFNGGFGNDYVWKKYIGNYTFVNGTQQGATYDGTTTVWYSSSVSVNANHEIALDAPVSTGTLSSVKSTLPGKYVKLYSETNPVCYFVTSSGSSSVDITYRSVSFVYSESNISYVNSPTSNAYPPSVSDGYTYTALGQIGNKANITSFSYVGTGGDKTITMPFPIKCAIVQTLPSSGDVGTHSFIVAIQWQNYVWTSTYGNSSPETVTWTENSFTIDSRNASGKTYFVVVFG